MTEKPKVIRYFRLFSHYITLIDGQKVEQVNHFKYLGSVISEDGYCEKDVRRIIAMAKKAFMEKKKLLTSKLNIDLKKIVKSTIWSVTLYAAET